MICRIRGAAVDFATKSELDYFLLITQPTGDEIFGAAGDNQFLRGRTERRRVC